MNKCDRDSRGLSNPFASLNRKFTLNCRVNKQLTRSLFAVGSPYDTCLPKLTSWLHNGLRSAHRVEGLCVAAELERWPSWSKARDSKSRRPQKGLEGSNPSLSAIALHTKYLCNNYIIMVSNLAAAGGNEGQNEIATGQFNLRHEGREKNMKFLDKLSQLQLDATRLKFDILKSGDASRQTDAGMTLQNFANVVGEDEVVTLQIGSPFPNAIRFAYSISCPEGVRMAFLDCPLTSENWAKVCTAFKEIYGRNIEDSSSSLALIQAQELWLQMSVFDPRAYTFRTQLLQILGLLKTAGKNPEDIGIPPASIQVSNETWPTVTAVATASGASAASPYVPTVSGSRGLGSVTIFDLNRDRKDVPRVTERPQEIGVNEKNATAAMFLLPLPIKDTFDTVDNVLSTVPNGRVLICAFGPVGHQKLLVCTKPEHVVWIYQNCGGANGFIHWHHGIGQLATDPRNQ